MVNQENFRVSGVFGKKLIESYTPYVKKENENQRMYKINRTTFFYYPKKRGIYISGNNAAELYQSIINKTNQYLINLTSKAASGMMREELLEMLENERSLTTKYHIFNIEVLTTFASQGNLEGFTVAQSLVTDYRMTMLEQYEPMLLALLTPSRKEQIAYFQVLKNTNVLERDLYFQGMLQGFSETQQEELEKRKQKIKI